MIYLSGDVEDVYARVRNFGKAKYLDGRGGTVEGTVEDTSIATLSFKNGVVGTWIWTGAAPGKRLSYNVYYGSKGSIYSEGVYPISLQFQGWDETMRDKDELERAFMDSLDSERREELFPHGITEGVGIEIWDFLDAVLQRRRPEVDGWGGLKAQAVCGAIFESAWCGGAVKVQDVLEGRVEGYQREINDRWGI